MSNILDDKKQQQILGLGRLGWSLRRIERATGVRRETASTYLKAAGIPTKYLYKYELHAKLIIADGVAFVGSENLSYTSLNKNREVGIFVTEKGPAATIQSTFNSDWSAGVNP